MQPIFLQSATTIVDEWAAQVYELSSMHFLPKEWIMERWEDGFYITAMAGSAGGSSLVVMSKGTPYTQQSYKVRKQLNLSKVKELTCSPPSSTIDKM